MKYFGCRTFEFIRGNIINKLLETGHKVVMGYIKPKKGMIVRSGDNIMVRDKLGWEPKFTLNKGLEHTYFWIKNEIIKKKINNAHYFGS
jgi:dTDP-D-glucose 4,6-dehydratase